MMTRASSTRFSAGWSISLGPPLDGQASVTSIRSWAVARAVVELSSSLAGAGSGLSSQLLD